MNNQLTKIQFDKMKEFYSIEKTKVILKKSQRNKLWKKAISRDNTLDFLSIKLKCPSLCHQILKSYDSGKNIQPAVFSECVYAQTYANMLGLNKFYNWRI